MKKLYIFLFLIIGLTGFGQKTEILQNEFKSGSGGFFDTVFDQYGNKYDLKDLKVGQDKTINNTLSRSTPICSSGIFDLYFETGSGMENTSDQVENARRAVVCQVFQDISNFIDTKLKDSGNNTRVKIWVRNISNIQGVPSGASGLASSFYTAPNNASPNFGGIIDGEIWKTIVGGKDSYINTTFPLLNSDGATNSSGLFYHGMVALNFTNDWNTTLQGNVTIDQYDLYTVVLHEVTHALGFNSLLKSDGTSLLGSNFKYYTRYDRFLKNNAGSEFLINNTGVYSMYNYKFNSSLLIDILQPNTSSCITDNTNCLKALKFSGTNTIPIYTPNCFEQGSSYSHFEDMCISSPNTGNNTYFVMSNAGGTGQNYVKRYLKPEERNALIDIGYRLNTSYGNNSIVSNSYYSYGGSLPNGINVAGINDGLNTNGTYSFVGNTGVQIPITGILSNDYNATSFEGLEDVFSAASFSTTSGNSTTTINFSSSVSGLHLLRYTPINTALKRGNITYIYVYVNNASNCAVPSACDLVMNGNFEQHNGFPTGASQLNNIVCGWNAAHTYQSNDYFHADNPLTTPSLDVPCNVVGFENDRLNGKAYIGMYVTNTNPMSETVRTKLKSPLLPNQTYQLSFDTSLSESYSAASAKIQAYLSNTLIIPSGFAYMPNPLPNPDMLFTSPYCVTTNGWQRVTFVFTTGDSAGEEYLYIGGLTPASGPDVYKTHAPQVPGCVVDYSASWIPYYYLDNVSLIPLNGASFNLPATICDNSPSLSNLTTYLTAASPTGVFSGAGVSNSGGVYSFNPSIAGVGVHNITYEYTNNTGCLISLVDTITIEDCSTPVFTTQINPMCTNTVAPTLPTTSDNGIIGTWNPPTINTTTAGTFTFVFTPSANQNTTTTASMSIVVNNCVIPTFTQIGPMCTGISSALLQTTSNNGIIGTWDPPTINFTTPGTYTHVFTPNIGQPGTPTSMTIIVNNCVTPTFSQIGPFCTGSTPPALPTTSNNGITGQWNPPTINTTTPGTYNFVFIRHPGQASTNAPVTIVIQNCVTTTFTQIAPLCTGSTPPTLPTTSNNGITGSWNSAISTATAGTFTYIFTPNAGQAGTNATMNIVVNNCITPIFTQIGALCTGSTPPTLPNTSNNGISGTWSSAISTATAGTFTHIFTPNPGQTSSTASMIIVVNNCVTPIFTQIGPLCKGTTPPTLPTTSNNGITGTWSSAINTTTVGTFTYVFTPNAGQASTSSSMSIVVNNCVIPVFTAISPLCTGSTPPILPTISNNGISGTWSSAISTATAGTFTYIFTPNSGQASTTASMTIVVNSCVTPTFTQIGPLCKGTTPPTLPTTSNNGITGTWSSAISTTTAGTFTYVFTPNAGQTSTSFSMSIVVNNCIIPTFIQIGSVCMGSTPPLLPTISYNGYTGTWNPSAINTTTQGWYTYIFTPTAGQGNIATTQMLIVTYDCTATFTEIGTLCQNSTPPELPTSSENGITGVWSPSTIDTSTPGEFTYNFTPDSGQGTTTVVPMIITIKPTKPTDFDAIGPLCENCCVDYTLPTVSSNGVSGTWIPSVVDLSIIGTSTYTFTPDSDPEICFERIVMNISVISKQNPICSYGNQACFSELTLSYPEASGFNHTYRSADWIKTNTNYLVSNQSIDLLAAVSVTLESGTHIKSGANFLARIENCPESKSKESPEVIENYNIDVYPNPTNSYVTASSSVSPIKSIVISSLDGKVVYINNTVNNKSYQFDMSGYQNGVYILTTETADGKITRQKLIKN